MKKSSDLSMEARGSGDRQRAKAAAMMEPGFMDMGAKVMAKKRTEPAPAQQANDAQKNMQNGSPSAMPTPFKRGGKVHDDSAEDKKLFNKMFAAAEKKEPKGMKSGGKWIAGAVKKPGALHRELGVPEGKKIPMAKIDKAANSSNPTLAKRANFAKTVAKFAEGGAVPRGKVAKFAAGGMAPPAPTAAQMSQMKNTPSRGAPMQETNSPDPAANARAAALNASRSVAPPVAGRTPAPVGRTMPPAPVAPMPAARAPTAPVTDPRGLASGIQSAAAASGIPAAGGVAGVPPRPYAMGGAAKVRKDVATSAGKPVAQPKKANPAWR